ncbi:MAG: phosphate acyltransferase PlsX [Lachnospiraceae bacterium]|nr:phosphate acyltransferase PlsX [Lachnospiraceae bacterium]
MVNIGLDTKGNDNGASCFIEACLEVVKTERDVSFTIYGEKEEIKDLLRKVSRYKNVDLSSIRYNMDIVDSKETIEMNDHPVMALRTKKESSIVLATRDLIDGKIDCLISAGSTGALLAASQFYVKPIEGIDRTVVGTIIPTKNGKTMLLDMGANMDPKADWLYQYALIGNAYFKALYHVDRPTIGLLSVGVEENKGNALTIEAYKLLKNDPTINFIGNVEARDVSSGVCDVLICDGFSGNVLLKMYEGTAKTLFSLIKEALKSNMLSKLGALLIYPKLKSMLKRFDAKSYGGAPYLGCNKLIIKCHGNSEGKEVCNAIHQAKEYIENDVTSKIKEALPKKV